MRLLLDTHMLLWALVEPRRLPKVAASHIRERSHEILYSSVSIWEIALKAQAGKPVTSAPAERLVEAAAAGGYRELPVTSVHAARIATLPLHHRDPFDRLLVAQALEEPARLLTVDRRLAPYSELVMVV
jgi:PIN domain nuclease of toxin-antitoxin system